MKIEKYINFNLTGNITLQILITWILVSMMHSVIMASLLSHFDDHIYKLHWTYVQFITHGQFIAFIRCVFTMTALYLITPSSFVMRVSIIYSFGIIGALSGDILGFMVKGIPIGAVLLGKYFMLHHWGEIYLFGIPLLWQWYSRKESIIIEKKTAHFDRYQKTCFFDFRLTGKITPKIAGSWITIAFIFNSSIILFEWAKYSFHDYFIEIFIINQSLGGLSIVTILLFLFIINPSHPIVRWLVLHIAGNIGLVIGIFLGFTVVGLKVNYDMFALIIIAWNFYGVVFLGSVYYLQWRLITKQTVHEEIVKRSRLIQQAEKNNLKALQAQVEPNFLCETLSNISKLMKKDPEKGKQMQMNLIKYLRISLQKTQDESSIP